MGKLKAFTFDIKAGFLINNSNGRIYGNSGSIYVTALNNDSGIISTAKIKQYERLDLSLLQQYLADSNNFQGGELTVRVQRLCNLTHGIIVAKKALLITSIRPGNAYIAASRLLFQVGSSFGCLNQGVIASLNDLITIHVVHNINNLAQGVILAKRDLNISSMGKVFSDKYGTMRGSNTNISGLALNLIDLYGEHLYLNAYRKIDVPGINSRCSLTIDVINGDGSYKGLLCNGKAVITHRKGATWEIINGKKVRQQYSNILLEGCKFNQGIVDAKKLNIVNVEAEHLKVTIDFLNYGYESFKVNNLTIKFLEPHDIRIALNIPNLLHISGPHSTISNDIKANQLQMEFINLYHKKGQILTNSAKFKAYNFATYNLIRSKDLKVQVANNFIYDAKVLLANNYELIMQNASDLKLPTNVSENYAAKITGTGGVIRLLHEIITGGDFILDAPSQQVLSSSKRFIRIHSSGTQNILAQAIDLPRIGMFANQGIKLHAKELIKLGVLPLNREEAASYIRSAANIELISDSQKIILENLDLISRLGEMNKILIQSPIMLDSIASKIWATNHIHLKVPHSIHRIIYEIIGSQKRAGNLELLSKCVVKSRPAGIYTKTLQLDGVTEVIGSRLGANHIIGMVPKKMETVEEYEKNRIYQQHSREEWKSGWKKAVGKKRTIYWETNKDKKQVTQTYQSTLSAFSDLDANFPEQVTHLGGVIIGNAGIKLSYHDLNFRNSDTIIIPDQSFVPIVKGLGSIEPSHFFQIDSSLSKGFMFNPIFGLSAKMLEQFHRPVVVITKDLSIVIDHNHQFTRLYHEQQEIEGYPDLLSQHGTLSDLGISDNTNFEDLYWEARESAIESYREFVKVCNSTESAEEQLLKLYSVINKPSIIYQEVDFQDGTTKIAIVSLAPAPKDYVNYISGIIARKDINLRGDTNSTLDTTGVFLSKEGNVNIKASRGSKVKIAKQQVAQERTVVDVDVDRNLFRTKVALNSRKVTELYSQEGSGIISAPSAAINIEVEKSDVNRDINLQKLEEQGDRLPARGVVTSEGASFIFGTSSSIVADEINLDGQLNVTVETNEAGAKRLLRSKYIIRNQERYNWCPTRFLGPEGTAVINAWEQCTERSPLYQCKLLKITVAEDGQHLFETVKFTEDLPPQVNAKGQAIFRTTGFTEKAVPPIFNCENIRMQGGGRLEMYAPLFKTKDLEIIAKEVLIHALKLQKEIKTTGKGLIKWNNYITKYCDLLMEENALQPILHADFIKLVATEGSVLLESSNMQGLTKEMANCDIEAKVDVLIKTIKLNTTRSTISNNFGFGISNPIIDTMHQGDIDPLINSVPLVANVKGLLGSQCEGEAIGYSLLTFYHAYDAYKKIQQGDFGEYLRDQIFSLSGTLSYKRNKTSIKVDDPLLSIIQASELLLKAANKVELEGVRAEIGRFLANAKQVDIHSATKEYSFQEKTSRCSIGVTANLSGLSILGDVGYNKAREAQQEHVYSELAVDDFIVLAEDASFKGCVVDAKRIFMEIKRLNLETPLDSSSSSSYGVSVGAGVKLSTGAVTAHGEVKGVTSNSAWADQQTGLHAREWAFIDSEVVDLAGGYLSVGTGAKPKITAVYNGHSYNFYQVAVAGDGSCAFYALGLNRVDSVQQLLEHCRDPEVARLIVNEFNCALREPTYVNFKNRLSIVFIEQFNYLDLESRKQRAVLNDYANQINNKYKPAIRHSAEQMINNLAAISEEMHLSSQERRTLQELSENERGALAKLREFLGRRENLEAFINIYIKGSVGERKRFWLGFDETGKNPGIMEALAKINKMNFRIWRLKEEFEGDLLEVEEAELVYEFIGDRDNTEYRDVLFKHNHFNILKENSCPGTLKTKELRARSVENKEFTKSKGFKVKDVPLPGVSVAKEKEAVSFDLGMEAQYSNLRSSKAQTNRPSILGEWGVSVSEDFATSNVGESSLRAINTDPNQTQSVCQEKHGGVFLAYAHGVFKDVFGGGKSDPKKDYESSEVEVDLSEPIYEMELLPEKPRDIDNSALSRAALLLVNDIVQEQGYSVEPSILTKILDQILNKFNNEKELQAWGEKFYFRKSMVASAGFIEVPLIVSIAAGLPAEVMIGGVVITGMVLASIAVYGFEKYKEYKKSQASFEAYQDNPQIFVTPGSVKLPKNTGLEPTDIPDSSSAFPVDQNNTSPYIFVPGEPLPSTEGFPDASEEFNRPTLLFSNKKDKSIVPRLHAPNPDHKYSRVPETFREKTGTLPGFEGSRYVGLKQGRARWSLPDGKIAEWDYQHGEIELYSKNGKEHLGAYDPYTGKKLKNSRPERSVKK